MESKPSKGGFFGETVRRGQIEGFVVSDVRFAPDVRIPRHSHTRPMFNFVLAGSYTEYWDRRSLECRPRSLLFHPLGLPHAERFSSVGARCLVVEFEPAWLNRLGAGSLDHAMLADGGWGWVAGRLRHELYAGDDLSPFAMEGLIHLLLAETARRPERTHGGPPEFIERAREILDDDFRSRPRLAAVAGSVGVHPTHLSHAFRRWYDCTPGEYLRRRRVDFACEALSDPRRTLSEISRSAGFADQSHFTRTFRRLTGMTPRVYRMAFAGDSTLPAR
jgi:AraC family transcriptional regulator